MKTLTTALLAVSIAAGSAQAGSPDINSTEFRARFLTLLSSIGALNHCERQLGYKITAKVDEVAYLRLSELMNEGLAPDNTQYRHALANFGDQVLDSADTSGKWTIGTVTTGADGKPSIKGATVDVEPAICASIEAHIQQEMKAPDGLVPKPSVKEPRA